MNYHDIMNEMWHMILTTLLVRYDTPRLRHDQHYRTWPTRWNTSIELEQDNHDKMTIVINTTHLNTTLSINTLTYRGILRISRDDHDRQHARTTQRHDKKTKKKHGTSRNRARPLYRSVSRIPRTRSLTVTRDMTRPKSRRTRKSRWTRLSWQDTMIH